MYTVVIIDYGSGNLRSAVKAFERAISENNQNGIVLVSARPEDVRKADYVVLPGVGTFGDCLHGLESVPELVESMIDAVIAKGRPFFGICIGMQLMATVGYEHGTHTGLNWIQGEVAKIHPAVPTFKIPHIGWNELQFTARKKRHPLLVGLPDAPHVYFVHSYHFIVANPDYCLATVDYGETLTAMVCCNNLVGVQFHPEKSQVIGLTLIANFLRWSP